MIRLEHHICDNQLAIINTIINIVSQHTLLASIEEKIKLQDTTSIIWGRSGQHIWISHLTGERILIITE